MARLDKGPNGSEWSLRNFCKKLTLLNRTRDLKGLFSSKQLLPENVNIFVKGEHTPDRKVFFLWRNSCEVRVLWKVKCDNLWGSKRTVTVLYVVSSSEIFYLKFDQRDQCGFCHNASFGKKKKKKKDQTSESSSWQHAQMCLEIKRTENMDFLETFGSHSKKEASKFWVAQKFFKKVFKLLVLYCLGRTKAEHVM